RQGGTGTRFANVRACRPQYRHVACDTPPERRIGAGDMRGDTSILIVGAGPTGLTAAVELARHGIVPRIIDRDDAPTPLSKAVGISSHSLDLLEPSGVTARLLNAGIRIRRGHVHYGTRELGVVRFDVLHHRFNFLLSLPQSETETLMADVL